MMQKIRHRGKHRLRCTLAAAAVVAELAAAALGYHRPAAKGRRGEENGGRYASAVTTVLGHN